MADKGQKEKEKGNAAFKVGNYLSAIGYYTEAVLADRKDPTYPLNRAAAYLKLGKYEDAERDCNTVLALSANNVKALFRRGQAKAGLGKFSGAQRDFTEALRLEPDNQATKEELKKVAQLIETEKRRKSDIRQADVTFGSTLHPTLTPKRRRVPITIVEPSKSIPNDTAAALGAKSLEESGKAVSLNGSGDIQELSSRLLKTSTTASSPELQNQFASQASTSTSPPKSLSAPSTSISPSPVPPTTAPKKVTFTQAKKARGTKTSKVGGGIFRASGQNTIFPTKADSSSSPQSSTTDTPVVKTRDEEKPTLVEEPLLSMSTSKHESLDQSTALPESASASNQPPATLFDLIRAWRSMITSGERWNLLQTIPPSNVPSFCKTSLDPTLLVSILEVFLVVLSSQPTPDDTNKIGEYMDNFTKVPRFPTLVMFLNGKEKVIAKEVWKKLGVRGKPSGAWNVLGDLSS